MNITSDILTILAIAFLFATMLYGSIALLRFFLNGLAALLILLLIALIIAPY